VYWLDADNGCGNTIPSTAQTSGTSYTITGLIPGHEYDLAISSINPAGTGPWGGAPAAIVGDGAPAAPVVSAASSDQLTWAAVPGATGYWIYQANPFTPPNPPTWTRLPLELPAGWNGTLSAGLYAVTAANGSLESPMSNQVQLPPAGSAAARTQPAGGSAAPLNPLAWVPGWLIAAPNGALLTPADVVNP
jgi:hypothetical protein